MERVGTGLDQPDCGDQVGNLRVTRQLSSRLERCERLSVAFMRSASKVICCGRLAPAK